MHLSFIQAVADALKVTIQIVESIQGFAPLTTLYPVQERNAWSTITIGHIDECHYESTTAFYSNASIPCAMNKRMILGHQEISILLCPYADAVCFSVIKSCTYWDSSTLQALHEHACLFLVYEKCNVDHVGKMPSNKTVSSDFKSFLSLIVNYVSISLHRRGGRDARD